MASSRNDFDEIFFFRNFSNRCSASERRRILNVRYSFGSPFLGLIIAGGVWFCDNSPLHGSRSRGELENRGRKTDANRKTFLSLEIRFWRNDTKCSSHRDLHFGILYVHFRNGVTNPTHPSPVVQGTRHKMAGELPHASSSPLLF